MSSWELTQKTNSTLKQRVNQSKKPKNFSFLEGQTRLALPKITLITSKSLTHRRRRSNRNSKTVVTPEDHAIPCSNGCGRHYKLASSLVRHLNLECGKPKHFWCNHCPKSYTRRESLKFHIDHKHKKEQKARIKSEFS